MSFIVALLLAQVSTEALDDPPTSGKFFYAQLFEQDYQLYSKTVIGNAAKGKP
jgi:hypothetical protein